ncbi:MAG: SRPBCC family protein [Burkholderiales bacterium]
MKRTFAIASLALLPGLVFAQAKELSTTQTIRIAASPEKVWTYVGDFGGLARWFPPAESTRLVLKKRSEEGAIRELIRRNGTRVFEKLVEYDPTNMRLTYTYTDGAVMASDYFATVQVKDAGGGQSEVVWSGRFTRLNYWQDPPPAGQDDESVTRFFTNAYRAGLEALKRATEAD